MALPSIDGTNYQVRIKWLIEGQECFNVLAFTSRGVQDLIDDLLTPVLACVATHLIPVLSNAVTLVGADVKNIGGSVAVEGEKAQTTDNVGTLTGGGLPSGCAAVLALRSAHPGRTGKGRMFVPGIDEESAAGSVLDATFIAAAVAFLACMFTAFHDSDPLATPKFHWVLHSRKDSAFYPIESTAVRSTLSYLRSRKAGT